MNPSRPTLLYEDLEGHRQPSLYYLGKDDAEAGPFFICDWNGAPTNIDEFGIDVQSRVIQTKYGLNGFKKLGHDLIPPDEADKIPRNIVPRYSSSETILSKDDGSQIDFHTVPPIARTLLNRIIKMRQYEKLDETESLAQSEDFAHPENGKKLKCNSNFTQTIKSTKRTKVGPRNKVSSQPNPQGQPMIVGN